MKFSLESSIEVLRRTPVVLDGLLRGLSADWVLANEGGNTWSAFDITAHLVYCDRSNWLLRAKHMLQYSNNMPFPSFDREGGHAFGEGKTLPQLLDAFIATRKEVLEELLEALAPGEDGERKGLHPQFGEVKLSQLVSAWVAHDLSHLSQANRVMARQYKEEVGPWITFLRILN
jgi:hypothetical protein